jgi:alpha-ribazole phosphatase
MSTAAPHQARWWWIRHAPVPDGGCIYGQRDLDCDCSDVEIFRILARELPQDAVWLTSNLARTKQTAAAILAAASERFAGVSAIAVADFAEQHLGQWQGLKRTTFYAARGVGTRTLWFAPAEERPPEGESFADLVARVCPAIARRTEENLGRDIVCVSHGGTIRAALAMALGITAQAALGFTIENCSITRIDRLSPPGVPGLWRVGCVNHRPWSRTPAGSALAQNVIALDKA